MKKALDIYAAESAAHPFNGASDGQELMVPAQGIIKGFEVVYRSIEDTMDVQLQDPELQKQVQNLLEDIADATDRASKEADKLYALIKKAR
jgi:hypothetical protein